MYNVEELARDAGFLDRLAASLETGAPPPLVRCAKIKLTSRCNLRCAMCKYWKRNEESTVSSSRWREVFRELARLGCRKLHFSGGEVFLRRDFLGLVEDAAGLGMNVNLTTNATLLDKEKARRLAGAAHAVSVSIDAPTPEAHDALRGRAGAFARATKALRRLRAAGPKLKLRVNCVLMRDNFRALPDLLRLAADLGADDLVAMPVDDKVDGQVRLTQEQIRLYNREVAPEVERLRRERGFRTDVWSVYPFGVTEEEVRRSSRGHYAGGFYKRRPCLAPWLHAFFAWDGAAYPCCMTNGRVEPLGDVGRLGAADVFFGEAYGRLREGLRAGLPLADCRRCDLFLRENSRLHAALDERRELRRAGKAAPGHSDRARLEQAA